MYMINEKLIITCFCTLMQIQRDAHQTLRATQFYFRVVQGKRLRCNGSILAVLYVCFIEVENQIAYAIKNCCLVHDGPDRAW